MDVSKDGGKKSRFHAKISTWGPLTLRTEPKLGMLRGVISVKQQSFLMRVGGGGGGWGVGHVSWMQSKRKGVTKDSQGRMGWLGQVGQKYRFSSY